MHSLDRAIEAGEEKDRADAAKRLGITRARVTQTANLMLLSPAIQEVILAGELRPSERHPRNVVGCADREEQSRLVGMPLSLRTP